MNAVKKLFVLTSTAAALLSSHTAFANNPATDHFYVTIRITPICEVNTSTGGSPSQVENTPSAGADIDFGSYPSNHQNQVDGMSKAGSGGGIVVKCTNETPYKIALKPASTSSETGDGHMTGLGTASKNRIAYKLYKDSGYQNEWGSQPGTNTMNATGAGIASPAHYPVYGRVQASELDKIAGRYFDRVAVEVSY